ncbi:hypothetical protein JL721_2934 [Aureococcus anophagefferens]|nr:hypothetical protein JL721_2934 [Aureococcus anophagefferens]
MAADAFSVPIHLKDLELPTSKQVLPLPDARARRDTARATSEPELAAHVRYVVDEAVAAGGPPKTPSEQKKLIAKIGHAIQDAGAAAVTEHFDQLYVLTRDAAKLDEGARAKLAVLLCETALGAAASGEALRPGASLPQAELQAGRDAFLMAAVLAQEAIATCDAAAEDEKKKPKGKKKQKADDDESDDDGAAGGGAGAWQRSARLACLAGLAAALGPSASAWLWGLRVVDEAALLLFIRAGARALLRKKLCAPAHREAAFDVVGAAYYGAPAEFAASAAAAVVEDLVLASEAGAQAAAECCAHLCGARGARASRRRAPKLSRVAAGAASRSSKQVATFVEHLGARSPAAALAHVATLKAHLSSANHSLRSAVVAAAVLEADAAKRADAAANDASTDAARERLGDATRARSELVEDASHWTRGATLRALKGLVDARAVPLAWYERVTAVGASRLKDKTAQVRKNALQLLGGCLEFNPYAPHLDPAPFRARYDALAKVVLAAEADRAAEDRAKAEAVLAKAAAAADADEEDEDEDEPAVDEEAVAREAAARAAQLKELEYFGSAVAFVDRLERAGEKALKLLRSATATDASCAAAFFGVARAFGLPCGQGGVVAAPPAECAARACALVAGCGAGDLACLEALVADSEKARAAGGAKADKAERIASPKLVRALWELAASGSAARGARAQACRFLAVARGAGSGVVGAPALTARHVVGDDGAVDCALAAALGLLVRDLSAGAGGDETARGRGARRLARGARRRRQAPRPRPVEASAFVKALAAKCGFGDDDDADHVVNAAAGDLARLLHVVGHVSLQLLAAAEDLGSALKKARVASASRAAAAAAAADKDGADRDEDLQAALGAGADRGDAEHEARMQHLVEAELVPAAASNLVSCFGPVAARVAAAGLPTASGVGGPTRLPPVLHRAAVLCLSKMACVSRAFCDDHLPLLPNSVEPWTEHVYGALRDGDATVRATTLATLAHLALNDMIKAKGGGVAEVALLVVDEDGGIKKRARAFFDELHRKSTATSSPIYNLVPDVISRLAAARRAVVDDDGDGDDGASDDGAAAPLSNAGGAAVAVAALAVAGFVVAKAPGAAVATPEERPSGPRAALSADDFATIMGFLLKFVDKEKHVETLAEKLCQRIESTKADDDGVVEAGRGAAGADDAQAAARRDFAFCLSKLQLSDKVARKLHEKLVDYKDALADAPVYETFCAIAARARKLPLPGDKTADYLDDWETKLLAAHEGRLDLDDLKPAAEPAAPPTAKKAPKKKPAPKKRAAKKKKKKADSDDDDDERPRPPLAPVAPARA